MERIEVRTFRQILEHRQKLTCYSPGCRRHVARNLAELVMHGLGDADPADCRPLCRNCGSLGERQLLGPVPTREQK